jgi:very-short-patch-repair endonuclease
VRREIVTARRLRRGQTDAEHALWQRLRGRQICAAKFRRQYPIPPFIVDFCCVERRLVIEIDGGQHAATVETDRRRTQSLQRQGYRVLRFWNSDVLQQIDAVLDEIDRALRQAPSP